MGGSRSYPPAVVLKNLKGIRHIVAHAIFDFNGKLFVEFRDEQVYRVLLDEL